MIITDRQIAILSNVLIELNKQLEEAIDDATMPASKMLAAVKILRDCLDCLGLELENNFEITDGSEGPLN